LLPPPPLAPLEPCRLLDTITGITFIGRTSSLSDRLRGARLRWGAQSSCLASVSFVLGSEADEGLVQCTVDALLFQLPPSPGVPPRGTAPIITSPPVSVALPSGFNATTVTCGSLAAPRSGACCACICPAAVSA
jgi:hypothetical protein